MLVALWLSLLSNQSSVPSTIILALFIHWVYSECIDNGVPPLLINNAHRFTLFKLRIAPL